MTVSEIISNVEGEVTGQVCKSQPELTCVC